MATVLVILGGIVAVVGGLWLIIEIFKESVGWGLACLLIPIATLAFVAMHWEVAKRPFLVYASGWGLILLSVAFDHHA